MPKVYLHFSPAFFKSLACPALQTEIIVKKITQLKLPKTNLSKSLIKICNEPGKNGSLENGEQKILFENYQPLQTSQIILGYQIQKVWENLEI